MSRPAAARQGVVFILVGGAATATHVTTALAMRELAGLSPLVANFVGYGCAVLVSYLGNAWLTFGQAIWHGPQFVRFVVVSLAGLALNQLIVLVATKALGLPFWAALGIVVVTVPVLTFTLSKLWAFRQAP